MELGAVADWGAGDSGSTGSVPDSYFSVIGKGLSHLGSTSKLLCQMAETPCWATGCRGPRGPVRRWAGSASIPQRHQGLDFAAVTEPPGRRGAGSRASPK